MGKLQLYIFRQLVWMTVIVTTSLTCIVWLTQSLRFVEMIVNRGLSVTAFVTFTLLLLPTFLSLIGPIALFAAVIFTYNKMINDSEIVVLRASGMSPTYIARPAIALALLLTVLGYINSLYLLPTAFREFKDTQRAFRSELSSVFLQEGVFNSVFKGITIFVRERSDSGELYGIIVHDARKAETPITIMAERGAIVASASGPRVLMLNGNRQEVGDKDGRLSLLYFDRYSFDLSSLRESDVIWREPRERYLSELFYPSDQAKEVFNYYKLRMEGLFRLSSPLLYVTLVLTALALLLGGDFNRRGQLYRILVAVTTVVLVHVVVLSTKSLGERMPQIESLMYVTPISVALIFGIMMCSSRPRGRRRAAATMSAESS